MKYKYYCFTAFNIDEFLKNIQTRLNDIEYYIYQKEQCGTSERPHLQGFISFKQRKTFKFVQASLPGTHIEVKCKNSTVLEAIDYCRKLKSAVGTPCIYGILPTESTSGDTNKYTEVITSIKNGVDIKSLLEEYPSIVLRHWSNLQRVRELYVTNALRTDILVQVYWGPPGTGKTRAAYEENQGIFSVMFEPTLWWDGYNGQSSILIDDFNGQIPFTVLLKILDMYPMILNVKGSTSRAMWHKVVITSNSPPAQWYVTEHLNALLRRIHVIKHFP